MMRCVAVLCACLLLTEASVFLRQKASVGDCRNPSTCGEPLYLTPLIKAGKVSEARQACSVDSSYIAGVEGSCAGFITTDEVAQNYLYFWYFETLNQNHSAPLVIWLQGGPGAGSLFGLFDENGPLFVDETGKNVVRRNITWSRNYRMLYIDNPVGAGFSYSNTSAYCKDTRNCVAGNLYNFLLTFYELYPELLSVDLYIAGESYGGHYVPAFGNYILQRPQSKIPLKGVAIGDGWTDPVNMVVEYGNLMYYSSLCDEPQRRYIHQTFIDPIVASIKQGDYYEAFKVWDMFLNGDLTPYPTYWKNVTGGLDYDARAIPQNSQNFGNYGFWIDQDAIRKVIHVGTAVHQTGTPCEFALINDIMDSYAPELAQLMNNVKVLLYSGQLDVIVGPALTKNMLRQLQWNGSQLYEQSSRHVWWVDGAIAGYVRQALNFTYVVVLNAGHLVPHNVPGPAYDMITRFIGDLPFM